MSIRFFVAAALAAVAAPAAGAAPTWQPHVALSPDRAARGVEVAFAGPATALAV